MALRAMWPLARSTCLLVALLDHVGERALAAVVAVEVRGHEHARAAVLVRALLAEPLHLVLAVHLVELEHGELHLLVLVRDLLRLRVRLLLALLAAAHPPSAAAAPCP